MSDELSTALVELKRDEIMEMVRSRIDEGEYPVQVLEECHWGMTIVGERFQEGACLLGVPMAVLYSHLLISPYSIRKC